VTTKPNAWSSLIPDFLVVDYTDIGHRRETNEDSMAWDIGAGVVALADGMGGCRAGEVASAMAVSLFTNAFRCWLDELGVHLLEESPETQAQYLRTWLLMQVQSIHDSILDAAAMIPDCMGMGTTLCGVIIWGDQAWVAHVGDSRVYAYDRDTHVLHRLTRDHSVVQEQIDRGLLTEEMARTSSERHLLTRALGIGDEVVPDITIESFSENKVLVLCTDGMSDVVSESLMARAIRDHPIELAGRLLLSQANTLGGQDNISIVLIEKTKIAAA